MKPYTFIKLINHRTAVQLNNFSWVKTFHHRFQPNLASLSGLFCLMIDLTQVLGDPEGSKPTISKYISGEFVACGRKEIRVWVGAVKHVYHINPSPIEYSNYNTLHSGDRSKSYLGCLNPVYD